MPRGSRAAASAPAWGWPWGVRGLFPGDKHGHLDGSWDQKVFGVRAAGRGRAVFQSGGGSVVIFPSASDASTLALGTGFEFTREAAP